MSPPPSPRIRAVLPHRFDRSHRESFYLTSLAIAGGDADHFAVVGSGTQALRVLVGRAHPSRIELPTSSGR